MQLPTPVKSTASMTSVDRAMALLCESSSIKASWTWHSKQILAKIAYSCSTSIANIWKSKIPKLHHSISRITANQASPSFTLKSKLGQISIQSDSGSTQWWAPMTGRKSIKSWTNLRTWRARSISQSMNCQVPFYSPTPLWSWTYQTTLMPASSSQKYHRKIWASKGKIKETYLTIGSRIPSSR